MRKQLQFSQTIDRPINQSKRIYTVNRKTHQFFVISSTKPG